MASKRKLRISKSFLAKRKEAEKETPRIMKLMVDCQVSLTDSMKRIASAAERIAKSVELHEVTRRHPGMTRKELRLIHGPVARLPRR
jgi:hypothetical protein